MNYNLTFEFKLAVEHIKCYLKIEIESLKFLHHFLKKIPFSALNPNQLEEIIHYVQKMYHSH